MTKIPVALQLYSVRDECAKDFYNSLESVAEMGYNGVEFAGYYGWSAKKLRRIIDEFGLKVAGSHLGIKFFQTSELDRTIEFNRVLGNNYLIIPSLPVEMTGSKNAWTKVVKFMNDVAEKLEPEGMQLGFHNHMIEFQPIEGELPWKLISDNTRKEIVMQLDVGNAMMGGVCVDEIMDLIRSYPNRSTTVHLKEYSSKNEFAVIGDGEMRWKEFFSLCESVGGTKWYIVEQEKHTSSSFDSVRKCKENLDLLFDNVK